MNEPLKYLIVTHLELPIVFNAILDHKSVAGDMKVVSAGFCRLHDDLNKSASAWGESVTLGVKSREEDVAILSKLNPSYDY